MNSPHGPPPNGPGTPGEPPDEADAHALRALEHGLGDDFAVIRKLGRGSMATVWLAREKALGRLVAIKVLLPGRAGDETARRRFEREAKASAALVHPNIVQVYRYGRLADDTPYLVMRFVKGRTMEERLEAEGRLPADLARHVLHQVTSALAAAHAQGIVHRDVRPANVLWDEESESANLADFGIAALLATGGSEATRLTRTGQMVGDPRHLSPEQLLDRDLTELADMYAVGVLGYELLTGDGPYEAKTNTQWITAHLSAEPKDLLELRPDVDPTVADLLRRCLAREPNHRPAASDAARILSGADVGAGGGRAVTAARAGTSSPSGESADLQALIRRRVPQIVLITAVAGWGLLQFVEVVFDNDSLVFRLTLPFVGCGILASTVVAWFHGEEGKQEASVLEWILLGAIALVWLGTSGWILAGR